MTRFFLAGLLAVVSVAAGLSATAEPAVAAAEPAIYLSTEEIEAIKGNDPCKNFVKQILALQKQMGADATVSDYYDLKVLPTDELVQGKKGRYYTIYLKDAEQKARFQFPGGRYVIDNIDKRFRRSMTAFVREVLGKVHGIADYELYVRGGASATQMQPKKIVPSFEYNEISYLPRTGSGMYSTAETKVHNVGNTYGNDDLPFLRAAFMQEITDKIYPLKRPVMLESEVSAATSKGEQFAELLLYIAW